MILPIAYGYPGIQLGDLEARVQVLESTLSATLGLLQTLLDRMESRLGPGLFAEDLEKMAAATRTCPRDEVARIDALIQQSRKAEAAREWRALAGVTWDQAYDQIAWWDHFSFEEKVRRLQLVQWMAALGSQQRR
jgi:hypothetical protein